MKLVRVIDTAIIDRLMQHDNVFVQITGLQNYSEWKFNQQLESVFVGLEGTTEVGVVLLQDLQNGYVSIHPAVYKEFRKKQSLKYFKKTLKILKRLVYPLHLLTVTRTDNTPAIKLNEKAGMKFRFRKVVDGHEYEVRVE